MGSNNCFYVNMPQDGMVDKREQGWPPPPLVARDDRYGSKGLLLCRNY